MIKEPLLAGEADETFTINQNFFVYSLLFSFFRRLLTLS